jgi:hypothetical protein
MLKCSGGKERDGWESKKRDGEREVRGERRREVEGERLRKRGGIVEPEQRKKGRRESS